MINARPVTDALLVILRATNELIGDGVAPLTQGQRYGVLEPLDARPEGGLEPEHDSWIGYRLRSVAVDPSDAGGRGGGPRRDAEQLDHILRTAALDRTVPIAGTGWRITGRRWESTAAMTEGPTTNVVTDLYLYACAT